MVIDAHVPQDRGTAAPRLPVSVSVPGRIVAGAWAAFGLAVVYEVVVLASGGRFSPVVAGVIGVLAVVMPTAVCWSAVSRRSRGATAGWLATAAVTAFAAGTVWNLVVVAVTGSLPVPSFGDLGFLAFYPLILGALAVNLRPHLAELRSTALVDGANGVLAVLAVLSIPLGPVFSRAFAEHASLGTFVELVYPVCDLLLASALIGVVVARGARAVVGWRWLTAGLLVFVATDITFAVSDMDLTSLTGTPMELGWVLGLVLVARWVASLDVNPDRRTPALPASLNHEYSQTAAPATAASATLAGLAVLVLGTRMRLSVLSLVLLGLTILMFGTRAQIALTQLKRVSDLRRLASTDDLTGLPNRRALYAGALERIGPPNAAAHALLLMDLDRFKEVNDSLGHHLGDRLLIEVGERLRTHLPPGALLARLGGDEFAIMVAAAGAAPALALADDVRAVLQAPFELEGIAIEMSASMGVALYPDDGSDLASLLRRADVAMYRAKSTHAQVHLYAPDLDDAGTDRLRQITEVRDGLVAGEFVVHYQPKLDLRTGSVASVEALVRWQHPVHGVQLPAVFLGLADDAGLMRQLTHAVLGQALDQVAVWCRGGLDLAVAVNLSAGSLMDARLPDDVLAMLAVRGLAPGRLQLEIVEDLLMSDRERGRAILAALRAQGVRIAIDDFGSGYSSLAYLRDLPIDELKLDRSFVQPMAGDARAAALVSSTIALAHSLDLVIIAEGVEDEATMAQLTDLGCDQAQGFHIARPMPGVEVPRWLAARGGVPSPHQRRERAAVV